MSKSPKQFVLDALWSVLYVLCEQWLIVLLILGGLFLWHADRKKDIQYNIANQIRAEESRRIDQQEIEELRQRAEQGDTSAQMELGENYLYGILVEPDDAEAVRWFRMAADQGHNGGYITLGAMAFKMEDAELVRKIYEEANNGDVMAQLTLGHVHWGGEFVPQSNPEALKWFRMAAEQGHTGSKEMLGGIYRDEGDYEQALKWSRLAADEGSSFAQYTLGVLHLRGEGVEKDIIEAARWILKAAEQGDDYAIDHLKRLAIEPKDWEY
jgi:TPR repeat protein